MESLANGSAESADGTSRNPVKKRMINAAVNISATTKVFMGFSCIVEMRGNSRTLLEFFLSPLSHTEAV